MSVYDASFSAYKSRLRGAQGLNTSFRAISWGIENMSPFSYRKAIVFLGLYPKIYKEVFRYKIKDPKEIVKYLPPIANDSSRTIQWFAAYLTANAETIKRFLKGFSRLDSYVSKRDYNSAQIELQELRAEFGESLVLQSREIRILKETSDLKTFTQEIDKKIKEYGNCVASLIVRISSRLYSDEFSYRYYETETNKFISTVTPTELRPFMSYWLLNKKIDAVEINKILPVASSSSLFDLFFTFTDLVKIEAIEQLDHDKTIVSLLAQFFEDFIGYSLSSNNTAREVLIDNIAYYGSQTPLDIGVDSSSNIRINLSDRINQGFVRSYADKFNPIGRAFEINFSRYDKAAGEFTDNFNYLIKSFEFWLKSSQFDISKMEYLGTLTDNCSYESEKSIHASAVKLLRSNDFNTAMQNLQKLDPKIDIVKDILMCEIYRRQGNLEDLITMCSSLIVEDREYSYVLPLSAVFGERWKRISSASDKLSLSICLYGLYLSTPSRNVLRNLRYAWSDTLKIYGVSIPSEIKFTGNTFIDERLVFFLRYICAIEVMETHHSFEKTRDIEEEMRSVYATLIQNDFNNEDYYQQKILLITTKLKIEDAIKKMDRSRIFVDIGMLISWAENNIADSLRRFNVVADREYKDVSEIFSNSIKSGLSTKEDGPIIVYVSNHESNAILANLIDDIRDNYLNNNDYGLDAYLSMRIRHGSFSGQLRSSLQNNNMIAYLSESSVYFYHSAWYLSEDSHKRRLIDEKIITFSRNFDLLIDDFLKNKLRIRSDERPEGFFDISLNDADVTEIKSIALEETSIAKFIIRISGIFREKINECLFVARRELEDNLKPEILNLLYNLRLDINSIIETEHADSFILNYESTIKELNSAFARVIEWFDFNGEFENNADLSFREYVDLFIESARYAHVDFGIDAQVSVNFDHSFDSMTIYRLNDIVFTLTDNTYKYSGLAKPKVEISFNMIGENILEMMFSSQIRDEIDKNLIERRTREILERISSGDDLPQTKSEGRSGLIKIANTARISGGDISFIGLNRERDRYIVQLRLGVKRESSNR